ncbi:MAG TPA: hypothetical protein VGK99_05495 [Acidobacteriota bacterium]
MDHSLIEDWADFIRGVTAPEQTKKMRLHLDSGCQQCREIAETLQSVADLTVAEKSFQPPPNIVRYIKSCQVLHRHGEIYRRWGNVARLVFDTMSQPLPAGMRSFGVAPRHLLFKSGSFLIDLRLESQPQSNCVCLTGQVVDSAGSAEKLKEVPVILRTETSTVRQTMSNAFGEFQLEFEMDDNLVLAVGEEGAVLVPLTDLAPSRGQRP